MQGKKNFAPQLFVSVNLLDLVPKDNFYRKLQTQLDLKQSNDCTFMKIVFLDFKNSILNQLNIRILLLVKTINLL